MHRITYSITIGVYVILVFSLSYAMYSRVAAKEVLDRRTDIRAQYDDARLLTEGINPYSRITNPDLPQDRFTFYFPGFLLTTASAIYLGADTYERWLSGWRLASLLIHLSIGALLFTLIFKRGSLLLAIIGSAFWFFSRWPLALYRSGQIDGPAILLLLLSICLWKKRRDLSCLLFGLSLAVKQMAIFLFPLYLFWTWQERSSENRTPTALVRTTLLCAVIPALLCLPFFIWNPGDFIATTLFPLTRAATEPEAFHAFLGLEGIKRKLPFLALLILVYIQVVSNRLTRYQQACLVLLVLISFTNTYFSRHFNWLLPFLILIATDARKSRTELEPAAATA